MAVKSWSKGGVTLTAREDGTLHVYAPEQDRVLSNDYALSLVSWVLSNVPIPTPPVVSESDEKGEAGTTTPAGGSEQSETRSADTVPSGEITTSRPRGRPRKNG